MMKTSQTIRLALLFVLINCTSLQAAVQSTNQKTNRLINESSPYLLQHAYNPVDWYPWGEAAFDKARKENKLLFISIGYSTCHWCHVMARESFENPVIAKLLNEHFVSIKVDREERPDIDRIYLTASEIMNGHGGWPTTVFATDDLKPFFAGTYYPPETRGQFTGLNDIINKITDIWQNRPDDVKQVTEQITAALKKQLQDKPAPGHINANTLDNTYLKLVNQFDYEYGGFSQAPKFPRTATYQFLYHYGKQDTNSQAHDMLLKTLEHMSLGGIYDHVGGGFHRYAVDAEWQVPHFEKMLYDQALITNSLLDAASISSNEIFKDRITNTLDFVLNNMRHPQGGFYSAFDADSTRPDKPDEHGEGAYYTWHEKDLRLLIDKTDRNIFYTFFNINETGNVASDPQNEFTGLNILYASRNEQTLAQELKLDEKTVRLAIQNGLNALAKRRPTRPKPHLDDKIISAWNGLMIKALARAGSELKQPRYTQAAIDAAQYLKKHLSNQNTGVLYRSFRNGQHSGEAYLDDYVYLVTGLLELHRNTQDKNWLAWAQQLTQKQIDLFWDKNNGGFYDNSDQDKNVLFRSKEIYDGSLPSGNAIAAENLIRLSRIVKNKTWHDMAEKTIHLYHERINDQPDNYPQMLASLIQLKQK